MIIREVNGKGPQFGKDCFFAENSVVVGEVTMGDQCSVWYNAVIRGDVHYIKIGNKVIEICMGTNSQNNDENENGYRNKCFFHKNSSFGLLA